MTLATRSVFTLGLLVAASTLFTGCATLSSLNPHRLEDTLANYHDDLRWGRTQTAERSVQAQLRVEWNRHHAGWMDRIRIVDMEVEQPRTRDGHTYVYAKFVWNFANEVETRESTIETRWVASGIDWSCDQETVVSGDRALLGAAAGSSSSSAPVAGTLTGEGQPQRPSDGSLVDPQASVSSSATPSTGAVAGRAPLTPFVD